MNKVKMDSKRNKEEETNSENYIQETWIKKLPDDPFEKYEKIKDIGKGSFGRVSLIRRKKDNKTLVWKELDYGRMSEKEK